MNICKRCGKENQEHYKFCLGCGGELGAAPAAAPPVAKTMMADALPTKAPPRAGMGTAPTPPGGIPTPRGPGGGTPPLGVPSTGDPGASPFGRLPATPFTPAAPGAAAPPGTPSPQAARVPTPGGGVIAPTPFAPPPGGSPFAPQPSGPPPLGGLPPSPPFAAQPSGPPPAFGQPSGPPPAFPAGPAPVTSAPTLAVPVSALGRPGAAPGSAPLGGAPQSPFGPPPATAGAPLGGTPATARPAAAAPPVAAPSSRPCPSCGTDVPASFMFCGACGTKLGPAVAPPAPPVVPAAESPAPVVEARPRGRLTLIRPDGTEGGVYEMEEGENRIGRAHGNVFENDGYLSPRHAEIVVNAAGAVVRDLESLNGIFVRMTDEEELQPGDVFRIGQELLRFDPIALSQTLEDGTEVMGSPNPGYWGRLSVIIGRDIDGSAFPLYGDSITVGRERGDINFPDDGYVSGVHARLSWRDGKCTLTDLGSSNGTFLRIRGERDVKNGTFLLLGQQLFRMDLRLG